MKKIRLWIADDHLIVRKGLGHIVGTCPEFVVAGESEDGAGTVLAVKKKNFDLLLLDLSMPDGGIDLISQLRSSQPMLPILVLTMHSEPHLAARAIQAGATGFVTKDAGAETLLVAIRNVAAGGRFMDPRLTNALLFERLDNSESLPETLSPRERSILEHLARGASIKEIAAQFGRSAKTVSVQKSRLMRKLRLENNVELFDYAKRHGFGHL
ncbi:MULTISPECIES: response regulator [Azonexaceae]|uniref:response regulator n=1 Tax=Azonexaceae TaxID=2008795 RepID=UPI001CF8B585|nr:MULTISPECIES: response regulator transcription factor [Azonexaceae]UCV21449.1 response regulator transcription factor [Ferribacterium limneticum]